MHGAIKFNKSGSIFGERGGAIGWGMGGALGIKLANPDKTVMAIIGDGSSMMTVQALLTAANYSIPVIYLICNNESYRILKLNMNVYKTKILKEKNPESKYIGADFPIPLNISKIAEAIGVYGSDNEKRLTGKHETQSIKKFSYGISDRGASIRIPVVTVNNGWVGYLEDRRPASNANPYDITKVIIDTIV